MYVYWLQNLGFDFDDSSWNYCSNTIVYGKGMWGTVAHWLEHWTHDHKVVGTSPDSSSLCWVPEQDS